MEYKVIEQWTNYLNSDTAHENCLLKEFMNGISDKDKHNPICLSCPCKKCSPYNMSVKLI